MDKFNANRGLRSLFVLALMASLFLIGFQTEVVSQEKTLGWSFPS